MEVTGTAGNINNNFVEMVGQRGGAIYNDYAATIEDINGDFIVNYTQGYYTEGGAIYNYAIGNVGGTIGDITGDFIANYGTPDIASAYGGAICSSGGTISSFKGNFINNYAYSDNGDAGGGAVSNHGNINTITSNFIANYAYSNFEYARGGAIFNNGYGGIIENINGNFIDNYSHAGSSYAYGGAVYNSAGTVGDITGSFINNHAYSNSSSAYGGAVYNSAGTVGDIIGSFINNHAYSNSSYAYGGAVYNSAGTVGNITGSFINNYTESQNNSAMGGAIYNQGAITLSANFVDNYAKSTNNSAKGGAIVNFGGVTLYGSSGSVNVGVINFIASSANGYQKDIVFRGNYVENSTSDEIKYESIYNASYGIKSGCGSCTTQDHIDQWINNNRDIYDNLGTITFTSNNAGTYTFYDYINGDESGTINFISDNDEEGKTGAQFNLYNDIKGQANINFKNKYILNMISPNDIHEGTSPISMIQAKNITIEKALRMVVDVDLSLDTPAMDHFVAETFTIAEGGSIDVYDFKIVGDSAGDIGTKTENVPLVIADNADGLGSIGTSVEGGEVYSETYTYSVEYNEDGTFTFTKTGLKPEPEPEPVGPTPEQISAAEVTAAATSSAQSSVDALNTKLVNREINKKLLSFKGIASGDDMIVTSWVETFGSQNDVKLKNLHGAIDTKFYGIVGGFDSKKFMYDNGIEAIYGVYGAFVGSKQKYGESRVKQVGEYLGASVAFRKGAFFSTVAGNVGYLHNEANTSFGKDKFETRVVSISNKGGVDIVDGKWTYTPSLYVGYTGVDSDDYTTKAKTRIENKFMHVFTIAPEMKVTRDFDDGLSAYAKLGYKMFFYAENKVKANGIILQEMSVKPYVEYGLGLEKNWLESSENPHDLTTYGEVVRHDGGRKGWDVNLGLKLDL